MHRDPFLNDWWTFAFDALEKVVYEDVADGEREVKLSLDLPGHDPKAIKISVDGLMLTVESERAGRGKVSKRYRLAETLDGSKIEAAYEHGVLTLEIPKRAESRVKTVQVKVK